MKPKIGKELEHSDVCIVHPIKGFWPFRKGSITKKPYYVYIRHEHVNWAGGKKLELVTHIPNKHSCVINDYLLNRMEYVGNLKKDPSLWSLLLKQDIK